MKKHIDITQITVRKLIKLSIKDHDRKVPNWNESLLIRGLYVPTVRQCWKILRSKILNSELNRKCVLARRNDTFLIITINNYTNEIFFKYEELPDQYNTKRHIIFLENQIENLAIRKNQLEKTLDVTSQKLYSSIEYRTKYYKNST